MLTFCTHPSSHNPANDADPTPTGQPRVEPADSHRPEQRCDFLPNPSWLKGQRQKFKALFSLNFSDISRLTNLRRQPLNPVPLNMKLPKPCQISNFSWNISKVVVSNDKLFQKIRSKGSLQRMLKKSEML